MRAVRHWAVRHSRSMEAAYSAFSTAVDMVSPLLRRLPRRALERPLGAVERAAKGVMFDCHMCGQCVLSRTGMACPMNCPKNLRNGPCGGIRADGTCELDAAMPCVWMEAWRGGKGMRSGAAIREIQHPVSHTLWKRSTWTAQILDENMGRRWSGMDRAAERLHADPPLSRLQARLAAGDFVVTAEFNPPDTGDPQAILAAAALIAPNCDAVNVTDGAGAHAHISSLATCALLTREGHEAVMQISCRDRNRIAMQADALGAAALGIRNILCMTGDGVANGDHPDAKPVFDLDASTLIRTLRHMRDDGAFLSGRKLAAAPKFFIGGTANPSAPSSEIEVARLAKKVAAGTSFLQGQFCFDMKRLDAFMSHFRAEGLHERCHLILGVGPLTSARAAEWMRAHVPGVRIPDELIARLKGAADAKAEGRAMCTEIIDQIRGIGGVSGIHIMAIGHPRAVSDIAERAAVGPRHGRQNGLARAPAERRA